MEKASRVANRQQMQPMNPTEQPPHVKARLCYPGYPTRCTVTDARLPWAVQWKEYDVWQLGEHHTLVPCWCAKDVKEHARLPDESASEDKWADPPIEQLPREQLEERTMYIYTPPFGELVLKKLGECVRFDPVSGAPRNPRGRTGMRGRGALGRWGPNEAADPIVTRFNENGQLQFVAIKRKDKGEWAIPGGMLREGEDVSQALRRVFENAFKMHALAELYRQSREDDPLSKDSTAPVISEQSLTSQQMHKALNELFEGGAMIYCGCALPRTHTTVVMSRLHNSRALEARGVRWGMEICNTA
jgi:hypothetical protein